MPVFNVSPYLRESIDSVLSQTYRDFILLILDDGSSDNTPDVVSSYHDDRIIYTRNETNIGLAANLNKGLSLVQTELVARMDGDDIAEPSWLEKSIHVLDTHPDVAICSSGFQFFGTKNSIVRHPQNHADSKAQMLFGCTVSVPVIRMSFLTAHSLLYDQNAFPAEDYHLWARCYSLTQVYNIQETLFHYRMHKSQISSSLRQAQIEKTNMVRLMMLDQLNPHFSDEDKAYFLGDYGTATISGKSDLQKMERFGRHLLDANQNIAYDPVALKKRLDSQTQQAVLLFVLRTYFSDKYTLQSYLCFLFSGYAKYVPLKKHMKFFAKSILHVQSNN